MTIRETIDSNPLTRYQLTVVGLCLAIVLAEGYDLLLMAFTASAIGQEWSLDGSQTGLLLSSALVGMALGATFVAPLADRVGRRPVTIGCLALVTMTMFLAAASQNAAQLGVCRLITGLGVGGLTATLPVITAEFAPRRRRGSLVALYTLGLPLGGVLGGIAATMLISSYGWRASFLVGGVLTLLLTAITYRWMPESIDYLLYSRPRSALIRTNEILRRLHIQELTHLPAEEKSASSRGSSRRTMLSGGSRTRLLLLGSGFFMMMASFYFASSWTPKLLTQSGFTAQQGINGGLLLNLGGVAGILIFSLVATIVNSRTLTIVVMMCGAVSFGAMALVMGNLTITLTTAVVLGVFLNTSASGLYAFSPDCFDTSERATAIGWASAMGRMGAIVSPIIAGILIDRGWDVTSLFGVFAIPLAIGALLIFLLKEPHEDALDRATATRTPETSGAGDPTATRPR